MHVLLPTAQNVKVSDLYVMGLSRKVTYEFVINLTCVLLACYEYDISKFNILEEKYRPWQNGIAAHIRRNSLNCSYDFSSLQPVKVGKYHSL